ncbi:MAG: type II secretion system F family protein [Oscillospiraceae bacterium]
MPLYSYKAMTDKGVLKEGSESADTLTDMTSRLRQRHLFPVSIEEVITGTDITMLPLFGRVRAKQLSIYCRQFAAMLTSGVTIVNCLDILRQQTQNRRLRGVTGELYEDVQKGLTFSESLKKHRDVFPKLMIQMIEAGESSGSLDTVISRVALHYEKENRINSRIKSAMIYPAVLAVICVVVVIFLLTNIMPTFIGMFQSSGVAIPGPTRFLLAISNALQHYWYIFLLIIIAVVFLFRRYAASRKGRLKLDELKLRLPIIKGLVQKTASARFTRTMATLLASGIPLLQAMENTAGAVGNAAIEEVILAAREDVRKGTELSVPIRRAGCFPPMVHSMIEIGEESGTLEDIMEKTANIYDEEVDMEVQRLLALMEPLMILVMAIIVGFIVISMMLPMFGMLQTI